MKLPTISCLLIFTATVTVAFSQTASREKVAGDRSRIEDRTFRARNDGTEQKFVLVYPPGFDSDKPVSLLIALHGHGSDRWQFVKQTRGECSGTREAATRHGMLMVSPDYRAKTSWMGPKAEEDLVQIIVSLKKQFCVEHVIVSGGSMGGTGALTFTVRNPALIDGVIALNGTANLVNYERFSAAIAASFGGSRAEVPDKYRDRSAEFFSERFTMPIAATTGGADKIVPPDSVLRLLKKIKRNNDHVLSIHRPDGGHSTNHEDTVRAFDFVIAKLKTPKKKLSEKKTAEEQP
ncbi:MAG: prolyl oligopeptidase family serine peptidase [Planctomycetaceae bacterium]|jgi:pimeloyl-ACP methyl ester carboxylesterase|nr:prolyl oligopeptidase family serine peptidase [Planctomycetaceae bacterium]